jgi:hypothetical protein
MAITSTTFRMGVLVCALLAFAFVATNRAQAASMTEGAKHFKAYVVEHIGKAIAGTTGGREGG